jgi:hypothetical protein
MNDFDFGKSNPKTGARARPARGRGLDPPIRREAPPHRTQEPVGRHAERSVTKQAAKARRGAAGCRGAWAAGARNSAVGWLAGRCGLGLGPVLAPVSPPFLVASTCGQAAVRHAATARLAERAPPRPPLRYAAAADDCRAGSCMCAARAPHSPFCPCCTCCIVFYPLLQLSSVESLTQIWYSSVLLLRRGAVTHGVPTLQFAALAVWHIGTHGYE